MPALGPNYIAGQASATINGVSYLLVGECDYRVADYTNETLKGMDGIHGIKGSAQTGMIKMKLRDSGQVDLAGLSALSSASVVVSLANGKVVSGDNMWRSGEPLEIATEDATFDIMFEGADVSEN